MIDKYDISTTPILTSLNMKIDDNIAGGDIYSSSNKNNFLLETISDSEDLKGRIKISSSLAKKLGINLKKNLHYFEKNSLFQELICVNEWYDSL